MDLNVILKSLRLGAKLKRPATVKMLKAHGLGINEEQLKRLEDGSPNKILVLAQDLLKAYYREGMIKPGSIESALLSKAENMTPEDRVLRYIVTNLSRCDSKKLAAITKIIKEIES